eukprot:c2677_g1_i1.p1 GENE.c2677_g1_i1~~c2677_g1_i1.p1  ORF type:complete len:370 (+),score=66.97 c2677_g1_i1:56-1165(+)
MLRRAKSALATAVSKTRALTRSETKTTLAEAATTEIRRSLEVFLAPVRMTRSRSLHAVARPSSPEPTPPQSPTIVVETAKKRKRSQSMPLAPQPLVLTDATKANKQPASLDRSHEHRATRQGYGVIAGVDEAGRGPLAGPVVAAACIVPLDVEIPGVDDSKRLNEKQREAAYAVLTSDSRVVYGVGIVDHVEIDTINILQASLLAMEKAVDALACSPDFVFVDGNRCPARFREERTAETMIRGDSKCFSIAAASIIAKVTRDRLMVEFDAKYPGYGFAQHKGYPTAKHCELVQEKGPCEIHRMTFAPLKNWYPEHPRVVAKANEAVRKLEEKRKSSTKRKLDQVEEEATAQGEEPEETTREHISKKRRK